MNHPTLTSLSLLLLLLASALTTRASDDAVIAAVRAADDERVVATMAADPKRMDAIYSDALSYTHSNGKFDNKKSYLDAVVSRRSVYTVYDYKERTFFVATPDIVIESAHVLITSGTDAKQNPPNDLNIQAVWRLEGGKWRFLSWLSSKIPPPAAPAAK